MVKWLGTLGYGAKGREFESQIGSTSKWKTLSVNPAVNWYLIQIKEGYGRIGEGAPPVKNIQDIVDV